MSRASAMTAHTAPTTISKRNQGDGKTAPAVTARPPRAIPTRHSRRAKEASVTGAEYKPMPFADV
jgi:hypothetical protein